MLGCLEMDIQTCIQKYIKIMSYVFQNARHSSVDKYFNIVGKYKQSRLKERFLEVIAESRVIQDNAPQDLRMRRTDREASCRVQVTSLSPSPIKPEKN